MLGNTLMRRASVLVAAGFLLFALVPIVFGESFDKPVRKMVLDLGPSPSQRMVPASHFRLTLSCFYYPAFMVKELDDEGLKGSEWVTISHFRGGRSPACHQIHDPAEHFLAKDGWWFMGSKRAFLFLEPADGLNGAMAFRVVELQTGRKIFQDTALVWESGREISPFEFVGGSVGPVSFTYKRSVETSCSIPKDGLSCWKKIRAQFGLRASAIPKCTGYVEPGKKKWVIGDEGVPPDDLDSPSVIAYPVRAELLPRPTSKVTPGPVSCTAPE